MITRVRLIRIAIAQIEKQKKSFEFNARRLESQARRLDPDQKFKRAGAKALFAHGLSKDDFRAIDLWQSAREMRAAEEDAITALHRLIEKLGRH
jgi:hypothetical protein